MIKISITSEDIKQGLKLNCNRCPVALALQRAVGKHVSCTERHINVTYGPFDDYGHGLKLSAPMPQAGTDFILAFDRGEPVEPFEFEVNL